MYKLRGTFLVPSKITEGYFYSHNVCRQMRNTLKNRKQKCDGNKMSHNKLTKPFQNNIKASSRTDFIKFVGILKLMYSRHFKIKISSSLYLTTSCTMNMY